MRQKRGHAQLGIAGQHGEHGGKLGGEFIFLPDDPLQLFADFIAHSIGYDNTNLVVLAQEGSNMGFKKGVLALDGRDAPGG